MKINLKRVKELVDNFDEQGLKVALKDVARMAYDLGKQDAGSDTEFVLEFVEE